MPVKSKVKISQNYVAFSEYMNFNCISWYRESPGSIDKRKNVASVMKMFHHIALCRKHRTNDMLLEKIPRFTSHYECSQMSRSLILIYCWLCSFFWKNDFEHAFQKTRVRKLANLFKNKLIFFLENNEKNSKSLSVTGILVQKLF